MNRHPQRHLFPHAADALGGLIAALARTADRAFDALGLAPPLLELSPEVREELREFFNNTIDPASVTIRAGHLPAVSHRRAFALPGLIYLGSDPGVVRSPEPRTRQMIATPTLVHELVHIWHGRFMGPRYVVFALWEQIRLGARAYYDWRGVLGSSPARERLPIEAHAQLVGDAYARRAGFSPVAAPLAGAGRSRDEDSQAMDRALTGLRAGYVSPRPGAWFSA